MVNKKGVLWNALGSTMFGVNSFVMLALVGRLGTVEQAGCFGIAFTTAQILYIIGLFGVPHYQMTDYQGKYPFSVYVLARFFTCTLMLLLCAVVMALLDFQGEKRIYTVVLTLLMLLNVVGELYQSLFFQKNRLDLSGSALFFRTFWSLLLFCIVFLATKDLVFSVLAQTLTNLLLTARYGIIVAPQFIEKRERSGDRLFSCCAALLWDCLPLGMSLLLMNLIINMSKYGIEFMMDDTAQGYYNMIFMPAQVINLCSQFLFKPCLNQYAALLTQGKAKCFTKLLMRQIRLVLALILLCCAAAFFLGAPVLGFIFNKDLSALPLALALIVFSGGIFALCQLFYYILVILRRQRTILLVYCAVLLLSVLLTWLMISAFGLNGAAISFGLTHVAILTAYVLIVKAELSRIPQND